jgi:hypothetical protein
VYRPTGEPFLAVVVSAGFPFTTVAGPRFTRPDNVQVSAGIAFPTGTEMLLAVKVSNARLTVMVFLTGVAAPKELEPAWLACTTTAPAP